MKAATLARESFSAWFVEALPILRCHWQELGQWPDIPLDVNLAAFQRLEAGGALRLYTARLDGKLVGYALYVLQRSLHYRYMLAIEDVFYVERSRRGAYTGMRLLKYADEQLRADGVDVVTHHVKLAHPMLGKLCEKIGYEPVETLWARRLTNTQRGREAAGGNKCKESPAALADSEASA